MKFKSYSLFTLAVVLATGATMLITHKSQAKASVPARTASYVIVDAEGHNLSSIFTNRPPTAVEVAYFDRYSHRLGKMAKGVVGCAPPSKSLIATLWDRVNQRVDSLFNTEVHAFICPIGGSSDNSCPDPDCSSSICFGLGDGCYDGHNGCNCPETRGC
jgi:hypothetical protein